MRRYILGLAIIHAMIVSFLSFTLHAANPPQSIELTQSITSASSNSLPKKVFQTRAYGAVKGVSYPITPMIKPQFSRKKSEFYDVPLGPIEKPPIVQVLSLALQAQHSSVCDCRSSCVIQ